MSMAVDSVALQRVVEQASSTPGHGPMQQLSSQFDALMAQPDAGAGTPAAHQAEAPGKPSLASEMIGHGEQALRDTFDKVQAFQAAAPTMDVREMTARQMELTMQVAVTQYYFSACTTAAHSSKSGLQTLMKNQ